MTILTSLHRRKIDLILGACVAIAALKLMASIEQVSDLRLHDESYYLYGGVNLLKEGLPAPEWGPIYIIWYYLLSQFVRDNLTLHFFNHQALVILTSVAFYLFVRALKVNPLIATGFSFVFILATLQQIFPRPTNFSLLILLPLLGVSLRRKTDDSYYSIAGLGLLLISFVRPEYFVSFLIFCIFYIIHFLKRQISSVRANLQLKRSSMYKIVIFALTSAAMLFFFGNPLGGDRSWWAFSQHFSVNWVEWNDSDFIPWTNYENIVRSEFGEANSISEALQANPIVVFAHLFSNLKGYLFNSIAMLWVAFDRYGFSSQLTQIVQGSEVAVLIAASIYVLRKRSRILQHIDKTAIRRLAMVCFSLLAAIIPSVLLVYPREHYLAIQSAMLLSLLAYLLSVATSQPRTRKMTLIPAIAVGIVLLIVTPNLARGWCLTPNACFFPRGSENAIAQPNLATVELFQSLNIRDRVNLLEAEGGYHIYLGDNYNRVGEYLKYDRFDEFIQKREINAIVLSHDLTQHHKFIDDEEFRGFLQNPERLGFVPFPVPDTQLKVVVKAKLISAGSPTPKALDIRGQ